MIPEDLQNQIEALREHGYVHFALQDRLGKLTKVNCGKFWPNKKTGSGWAHNADEVCHELVKYVLKYPKLYTLHYSKNIITKDTETLLIDTRPIEEQKNEPYNLADMTESTKENRNDLITLGELKETIGELKGEIKYLREKNADLNKTIINLEESLQDEEEGNQHAQMADTTTSTIGQFAQLVPTLLDKYFAIQEQKNALLAEQIRRTAPNTYTVKPENNEAPKQRPYYQHDINDYEREN
jgi:hypothetical protein